MSTDTQSSIRIAIDRDGLKAHLTATGADPQHVTREKLISAVREAGILLTEDVLNGIQQIEQSALSGQLPSEPVLIAEGRPPVKGTGATFKLAPELLEPSYTDPDSPEERVDHYRSQILTIQAEQVIGTLTPAVEPVPGIDVFGKPIPAAPPPRSVQLGKHVRLAEDGLSVVPTAAGKLHITRHQISVVPVVEIEGDVDFSTGNVDAPSDVLINGTVRDSFRVRSAASITIRGAIEAAEIEAGTEVQVNGGIASRGQGRVVAGGELFTKFCNEARVEARCDLTVTREVLNSYVRTDGKLLIVRGKLIGGRAYARCGANIGQIGNEANLRTLIAVGADPRALAEGLRAAEVISKKLEAIAKIRQNVEPLLSQLKRLTPAQRERATELLYQADSMEQEVREQEQKVTAASVNSTPDGQEVAVTVQGIAYPGTAIIIGNRLALLHRQRRGPFKVVRRLHQRMDEMLLVDKISGSVTVLNSREYDAASADADFGR